MVAQSEYQMEGPSMHGYNNEICYHQIHHHDDDPVCVTPNKRRRVSMSTRVRFDDRVTVMNQDERGWSPRDNPSEMEQQQQQHPPSSLWLTPNDFTKIQNSIFTTLEMMKLTGDFGRDTPLSNRYCARGLENCDLECKGSLTEEALARRRNVIGAVLHEQNIQRKRQMEASLSSSSSSRRRHHNLCNRMGGGYGVQQQQQQQRDDHHALIQKQGCTKIPEHGGSCVLDHFRIGLICMNLTHGDIMDSIDRGRQDSEEALEIYRTKPLPLGSR